METLKMQRNALNKQIGEKRKVRVLDSKMPCNSVFPASPTSCACESVLRPHDTLLLFNPLSPVLHNYCAWC